VPTIRARAFHTVWRNFWFRFKSQTRHTYVVNLRVFKFKFAVHTFQDPLGHVHLGLGAARKLESTYVRHRTNNAGRRAIAFSGYRSKSPLLSLGDYRCVYSGDVLRARREATRSCPRTRVVIWRISYRAAREKNRHQLGLADSRADMPGALTRKSLISCSSYWRFKNS
jgi:hypothetical protein